MDKGTGSAVIAPITPTGTGCSTTIGEEHVELENIEPVQTSAATHLRCRVPKRPS